MTTFLDKIVAETRERIEARRPEADLGRLRVEAEAARRGRESYRLASALSTENRVNIIAEIKRASPSRNVIDPNVDAAERAATYERNGAAAISILTEPKYFGGSLDDIRRARAEVKLPILRKDFIVDESQILDAAIAGADAILLIVAALDEDRLRELLSVANELGLDALVETHDLEELHTAARIGAKIIGVNNRDLHTLEVDLATSFALAEHRPAGALLVAESGIRNADEIKKLREAGFNAFLIGEALMFAGDPAGKLAALAAAGGSNG
ncbi:MAG: indole-3-glycerol-phosphate synthase [Acidobacteria bacterium OLB17]|nr:MAG: indole-3-glycerol-phosphate synthase [Acidobacteria bacterium OLB17]MCZ2389539.1 indole-3-glycerol phosphate synthase TrpC [Acidobacteriota bacterium]